MFESLQNEYLGKVFEEYKLLLLTFFYFQLQSTYLQYLLTKQCMVLTLLNKTILYLQNNAD